jgi:hypothetical protein
MTEDEYDQGCVSKGSAWRLDSPARPADAQMLFPLLILDLLAAKKVDKA